MLTTLLIILAALITIRGVQAYWNHTHAYTNKQFNTQIGAWHWQKDTHYNENDVVYYKGHKYIRNSIGNERVTISPGDKAPHNIFWQKVE